MQFRWILPDPQVMKGMLFVGSGEMEMFGPRVWQFVSNTQSIKCPKPVRNDSGFSQLNVQQMS